MWEGRKKKTKKKKKKSLTILKSFINAFEHPPLLGIYAARLSRCNGEEGRIKGSDAALEEVTMLNSGLANG